jgi:hypothetical protein
MPEFSVNQKTVVILSHWQPLCQAEGWPVTTDVRPEVLIIFIILKEFLMCMSINSRDEP